MIRIILHRIPSRSYIAAVFGVLYGSAFHIADNTADVVFTCNVQTVINEICAITNSRIYGMTN